MQMLKSQISLTTAKLSLLFNDTSLATGTVFFYEHNGASYLLTNRHNFTGRHQTTGEPLHSMGGLPNRFVLSFPRVEQDGTTLVVGREVETLTIACEVGARFWLEHPTLGASADVAALNLSNMGRIKIHSLVNTVEGARPIALRPALPVSVVGYPFGQSIGTHYPVWVSGHLASEPNFDADNKPALLIDCRTNRGSSGSPVFAYVPSGITEVDDPDERYVAAMTHSQDGITTAMHGFPVHRFIGIYSGRINDNADIGFVWRESAIREVCEAPNAPTPILPT